MAMNPRIGQGITMFLIIAAVALWIVSFFFPVPSFSIFNCICMCSLAQTVLSPVNVLTLWDSSDHATLAPSPFCRLHSDDEVYFDEFVINLIVRRFWLCRSYGR